jgi:phage-related minor tail protein
MAKKTKFDLFETIGDIFQSLIELVLRIIGLLVGLGLVVLVLLPFIILGLMGLNMIADPVISGVKTILSKLHVR